MKIKILVTVLMMAGVAPAQADDRGAWVAVDANGNAVSQAIVCTPAVCGNKENPFMGQHWVLQAPASSDGNVAGVGANQGAESVKVNLDTKVWSVQNSSVHTNPVTKEVIKTTTIQEFTAEKAPWAIQIAPLITVITTPVIAAQEQQIAQMYQQREKLRAGLKAKKKKVAIK
jgi:hypothetical protein